MFELSTLIQLIGYPGIFAIIFLESGVFFGFFLPGASLLFSAGLLASQGLLNIWILIPLVTIAAILGDNVGYWFGAKIGIKLFTRPNSRFFRREHLAQAQHFYERHGAQTIVIGRFIPIIRTFAPIVAGIAGMNYKKFLFFNMIGALAWGAGVTYVGFILSERIPIVADYFELILLIIVILTTLPLVYETVRRYRKAESIEN